MNQVFNQFSDIQTKEIAPGFFSKIIHTENNTINFIEVKAGCVSDMHQHINHQCAFVIEGTFELTVDGVTQLLDKGNYAVIPPNVIHGGRAITDCKLIDIFNPVRQDFKLL
ncbi:cupin domain-containing protein [Mucilaginibacter sp. SP1R1]|uniref:cupin domain-containing protein n=1 Tax=Mucilaginibacter sp. SP1R1 TaxID=2723091 RepID=UPI0016193FD8|nr:cupin domain-containing protein [Mucilaginibacter sp. SP1R1]MBB6151427.1 quercetin dioxygenase-like cupin family protein [Mucilaginibacter sp. SP1R1]